MRVVKHWNRLPREAVDAPSLQSQVGWSSEQPGLVEDVPTHGSGVGTRWSSMSLPTQTILWLCDSMILPQTPSRGSHRLAGDCWVTDTISCLAVPHETGRNYMASPVCPSLYFSLTSFTFPTQCLLSAASSPRSCSTAHVLHGYTPGFRWHGWEITPYHVHVACSLPLWLCLFQGTKMGLLSLR